MNASYRNGVNHTATSPLSEPSDNGANGELHHHDDAPSANGDIGKAARLLQSSRAADGPSPSANGANGRDQRGRFAKGNPGGPGNPFARRTAQLRRVLSMAVTEEDVEAVAKRLLEQAKAGDVGAARLLLSYAIGQPTEAVDPDTLDQQEWAIFRQVPVPAPEVERLIRDVPIDFACELARALVPHLADIAAQKAKPILAGTHEPQEKRTRSGKRRRARTPAVHFAPTWQNPVDTHSRTVRAYSAAANPP